MKNYILTMAELCSVLVNVSEDLKEHAEELRQLDAIFGDGDLGITIGLASNAIIDFLEAVDKENDDIGSILGKCGKAINKASPSTFGTLLATAFLGASRYIYGKKFLNADDLLGMGIGAVEEIKKRGKADVGDKTMLDSLAPAIEAYKRELAKDSDIKEAFSAVKVASEVGMQLTKDMKAKHGRARWHQENSCGVVDAGAAAMNYIIQSFARHLTN